MPRLLRSVARTAVVAGTATAVSNRVSRRPAGRWSQQEAAQQEVAPQAAAAPAAQPAAPTGMDPKLAQLQQLADLKQQGMLSDAEFEAQKARILGG
jgi:hypothetical protein